MKKVVTFGEIMMRLSTPHHARFTQARQLGIVYAGSEANVSASLAQFQIPAEHVTRFPENDFGKAATETLQQYGVITQHIVYGNERMGLYFVENGASQRASRVIYDRFDSAFAHIKPDMLDWDEIFKDAQWFHWSGITPAISDGAAKACYQGIRKARKLGLTISGDINYRRNLWQYGKTAPEVMTPMISETDIIIGGRNDFENILNITSKGDKKKFESVCEQVMKKFPNIKKITTTKRETVNASHNKISAVLWDGKKLHESTEYDITHIVDRIGTGDAFVAGLIYSWINKKTDKQTLEFATAACTLKHSIEGDVNLATVSEIDALIKGDDVGKLKR